MTTAIISGQRLTPAVLNGAANAGAPSVQNTVSGGGTLVNTTTYTATLTTNGGAAIAFVAPPSGRVDVGWSSGLYNDTAAQEAWCSWELRTGASIGSGSTVAGYTAHDDRALRLKAANNTNDVQFGDTLLVEGLTPGAAYHVRQMFRTSAHATATATFARKKIKVVPAH